MPASQIGAATATADFIILVPFKANFWELRLFFPVGTSGPLYQKENYETQKNGN
jgi:hypothetical protein